MRTPSRYHPTFRLNAPAAVALKRYRDDLGAAAPKPPQIISEAVVAYCTPPANVAPAPNVWAHSLKYFPSDVRAKIERAVARGCPSILAAIIAGMRGQLKIGRDPVKHKKIVRDRRAREAQFRAIYEAAEAHFGRSFVRPHSHIEATWEHEGQQPGRFRAIIFFPWMQQPRIVSLSASNGWAAVGKAALVAAVSTGLDPADYFDQADAELVSWDDSTADMPASSYRASCQEQLGQRKKGACDDGDYSSLQ